MPLKELKEMREYFGMNVGVALEKLNNAYSNNSRDGKKSIKEAIDVLLDFGILKPKDEILNKMNEEYTEMYSV